MAVDRDFEELSAAHSPLEALPGVIAEAREAAGISQRTLAKRCGLQRTYISKLENGHVDPTIRSLMRIAGGLRLSTSTLMERAETRIVAVVERRQKIGRLLGTIPPAVNLEVQKNGHV